MTPRNLTTQEREILEKLLARIIHAPAEPVRASTVALNFQYLVILAQHYNQPGTFAQGDLNGDGQVDFKDLVILAANYGKSLASIASFSARK